MREAQAVIIGAGAFGASIAYHLARLGWRDTVLLDRFELGAQTSPRAAGLTAQVRSTDLMTRLATRSVQQLTRFAADTGEPLEVIQPGSVKIARTAEHEARLRADVERGRRLGLEIDLLPPAEVGRLSPFIAPPGIRAATYVPSDVYLEPGQLPRAYARAAGRLGVTLLPHTAATGFTLRDGAVQGVLIEPAGKSGRGTQGAGGPAAGAGERNGQGAGGPGAGAEEREEIRTPVVVDAAGAWARQVGDLAGGRIPVVPTRHQLLITEPVSGVAPDQPIVRVIDANVYVRPERGGLLMGGYEDDPLQVDVRRLAPDFSIDDLPLDLGVLHRLAALVLDQLPVLRDLLGGRLGLREHRGGLPTMTADGQHLVGPVPGVRGLYVAGGCCVGGLTISPAVGEALATWIVSGEPPFDLTPLAPGRFGPEYADEARLAAAARARYVRHYSVS